MAKRKGSAGKGAKPQATTPAIAGATAEGIAASGEAVATPPNASAPKASAATISRKEMLREAAERKRRKQNMWIAIGGVVVVALIAVGVYMGYRNSLPVVGETTYPTQGNLHIPLGSTSTVTYNSTPPTTGPHYENLAAWGIQRENVRYEHLIHNLEDAGVVIYYQCDDGCPELVAELTAIIDPYLAQGRHVVLARNDPTWTVGGSSALHKDMGAPIAIAAWRKLLLMDEVDADVIRTFIDRYEGIDHHRG